MEVRYNDPLAIESADNIRFDFEDWLEWAEAEEERYFTPLAPARKRPSVCKHWMRGLCKSNQYTCEYYHVLDQRLLPVCYFYTRGTCMNPNCQFRHPVGVEDTVFCVAYARGFCKLGPKCEKKHEQLSADELVNRERHIRLAIESNRRENQRRPQGVDEQSFTRCAKPRPGAQQSSWESRVAGATTRKRPRNGGTPEPVAAAVTAQRTRGEPKRRRVPPTLSRQRLRPPQRAQSRMQTQPTPTAMLERHLPNRCGNDRRRHRPKR